MNNEKQNQNEVITEQELMEITEEICELEQRAQEDEMVSELLLEIEEESGSKKKLKELKRLLSDAQKKVEKAECLLREVINEREKEDRAIEDAILLSDGIRKVQEREQEEETED